MTYDVSYSFDDAPSGAVQSDSFGARIFLLAEGAQLTLRFDSLDDLERVIDELQHDVALLRSQQALPFVAKPRPDGVALRLAMGAGGHKEAEQ